MSDMEKAIFYWAILIRRIYKHVTWYSCTKKKKLEGVMVGMGDLASQGASRLVRERTWNWQEQK